VTSAQRADDNNETKRPPPGSRPPANIAALQLLITIADEADDWQAVWTVEHRDTLEANLSSLVGLATRLTDETLAALAANVASWRNRARKLTGWELRTEKPPVPCPLCDDASGPNRGLRVNPLRRAAVCLSCGERWDTATIGLLAEYVSSLTGRTTLDTP
jgi:hypothetical protein